MYLIFDIVIISSSCFFLLPGDELLYMDPHEVQPYVPNFVENMDDSSYHTNKIWKMKFSQLDPSIALVDFFL